MAWNASSRRYRGDRPWVFQTCPRPLGFARALKTGLLPSARSLGQIYYRLNDLSAG